MIEFSYSEFLEFDSVRYLAPPPLFHTWKKLTSSIYRWSNTLSGQIVVFFEKLLSQQNLDQKYLHTHYTRVNNDIRSFE